jgi:hypothetical protein
VAPDEAGWIDHQNSGLIGAFDQRQCVIQRTRSGST